MKFFEVLQSFKMCIFSRRFSGGVEIVETEVRLVHSNSAPLQRRCREIGGSGVDGQTHGASGQWRGLTISLQLNLVYLNSRGPSKNVHYY